MPTADGLQRAHSWVPHGDAIAVANSEDRHMSTDDFIDRYLLRCKELSKAPRSGEWLRWFLDESAQSKERIAIASRISDALTDDSGTPTSWHV